MTYGQLARGVVTGLVAVLAAWGGTCLGADTVPIFGRNVQVSGDMVVETPSLAVDEAGNVYVVGRAEGESAGAVEMFVSQNGGRSFGEPIEVSPADGIPSVFPCVAAFGGSFLGEVIVGWSGMSSLSDAGYYVYATSSYGGMSLWLTEQAVSAGATSVAIPPRPDVAASVVNGVPRAYFVWDAEDPTVGGSARKIWFRQFNRISDLDGVFPVADQRVDNTGADDSFCTGARIATPRGPLMRDEVHIVWACEHDVNVVGTLVHRSDVYYTYGEDINQDGVITSDEFTTSIVNKRETTRVDLYSTYQAEQPDVAVDKSGNVYVVYSTTRRNGRTYDIYFSKKLSVQDDFSQWYDIRVTDDDGSSDQRNPRVAVDESLGIIYVVWEDNRNGHWDVYFAYSTDGGYTWSDNVPVNATDYRGTAADDGTSTTDEQSGGGGVEVAPQLAPEIAVDARGSVYVTWQDGRDGTYRTYFDKLMFYDDGVAPSIIEDVNARIVGDAVEVTWAHSPEFDIVGYDVYRAEAPLTSGTTTEGTATGGTETGTTTGGTTTTTGGTTTTKPVRVIGSKQTEGEFTGEPIRVAENLRVNYFYDDGVFEGTKYTYWVVAKDVAGRVGPIAPTTQTTTGTTTDTTTGTTSGSTTTTSGGSLGGVTIEVPIGAFAAVGGTGGSTCFIATASAGSDSTIVDTLRCFRGDFLTGPVPGSTFVRTYYASSPVAAAAIRYRDSLRALVRRLLHETD